MRNLAIINLRDLQKNALKIKKVLPQTTKLCGVVKADAYGHGAVECANALYSICDLFAVAIIEEGIEIRQGGIDKEILVLVPPLKCDLERALSYRLTLTVDTKKGLLDIERLAKKLKTTAKVHIAFNSGMNRLGVDTVLGLKEILDLAKGLKYTKISGFYSHFGCPENDNARKTALDKFLLANKVVKGYNSNIISHISASGGFLKGVYMDMVRIGILLYGYKPFESKNFLVKPIMKVYSPIIKNRTLSANQNCMYGSKKLKRRTAVSIVRVGYADGLFRKNVHGIVNNRCMDLTALKGQKKGMACVLSDAEVLAKQNKTISYEILVRASARAERKYIR